MIDEWWLDIDDGLLEIDLSLTLSLFRPLAVSYLCLFLAVSFSRSLFMSLYVTVCCLCLCVSVSPPIYTSYFRCLIVVEDSWGYVFGGFVAGSMKVAQ